LVFEDGRRCRRIDHGSKKRRTSLGAFFAASTMRCYNIVSMTTAEKYARRARNSDSLEDVAYNLACAVEELAQAIRDLEARVKRLESKVG
jgi:uncharacterized protein YlxW (UPF0749 family)